MKKLVLTFAAVLMVALAMTAMPVLAATDYPTKQITYLIVFDPGGQSDLEARPAATPGADHETEGPDRLQGGRWGRPGLAGNDSRKAGRILHCRF